MKNIRLPKTTADRIHLECFRKDGSSYCIESKRCHVTHVDDDVIDVAMTPLFDGRPGETRRWARGWGTDLRLKQQATATIA